MKFFADVKVMGNTLMLQVNKKINLDDGRYEVDIKDFKGMKRSERQNSMLWGIINKICKKINGNTEDNYDLYCQLLEMAGAEYDDVKIKHIALPRLKELARHVKVVHQVEQNGELYDYCWIFKGISEMDTKHANDLIETTKMYANRVGVDVDEDYWKEILNVK